MASQLVVFENRRLIDSNGIADGGNLYLYLTGTTTKVTLYSDAGLTTTRANPVVVSAGAQIPDFYYDDAQDVRLYVTNAAGDVIRDQDPYVDFVKAAQDYVDGQAGIFRSGLRAGYLHSVGPISVGTASVVNQSFDTTILAARLFASPTDNSHGISTSSVYSQMNGYAFAPFDARDIVNGTTGGNHIAVYQAAVTWNASGTLDDYYCVFASPLVTAGTITRSFGLFYQPAVSGSGSVTQHVALNVPNLPEYTNPGAPSTSNTNYVFRAIGGKARGRIDGQISAGKFHVGSFEGGAVEAYTVFIDGTDNAYTYYGQSGVWNWRTGMTKDQTSFYIRGNNSVSVEVTAVSNHVLPGVDGTQNLGSGSKQWNNIYLINAPIVSSDERFKTDVAPLSEAEIAWSKAIATVRYRLIADPDKLQIGVIAQQVYAAGIAAGIEDPFAYNFLTQTDDRLAIRYEQLLAFIVAGQEARIAQLEAK